MVRLDPTPLILDFAQSLLSSLAFDDEMKFISYSLESRVLLLFEPFCYMPPLATQIYFLAGPVVICVRRNDKASNLKSAKIYSLS